MLAERSSGICSETPPATRTRLHSTRPTRSSTPPTWSSWRCVRQSRRWIIPCRASAAIPFRLAPCPQALRCCHRPREWRHPAPRPARKPLRAARGACPAERQWLPLPEPQRHAGGCVCESGPSPVERHACGAENREHGDHACLHGQACQDLAEAQSTTQNAWETPSAAARTGDCNAERGVSAAATKPRETRPAKSGASTRFASGAMSDTSPKAGQVSGSVKSWATTDTPRASQAFERRRPRAWANAGLCLPGCLGMRVSTSSA